MLKIKTYEKSGFLQLLLVICFCSQSTYASLLIDQHNDSVLPFQGFSTPQSIGQSFVPSTGLLSAVELQINEQSNGDGNGFGAFIKIHENSIVGNVLGVSELKGFADAPSGPISPIYSVLFDFATPIALTPGDSYVIEILPALNNIGNIAAFVTGFNHDGYAQGSAIASFSSGTGPSDLWFRTYYPEPVPEPGSYLLIGLGFGVMGWVARKNRWL